MIAPEGFTISVEFVAICMDYVITWQLNGKQIINDSNHQNVISGVNNSRYKASLRIIKSSERDAGEYKITVASATGNDSAKIIAKISSECIMIICDCLTKTGLVPTNF